MKQIEPKDIPEQYLKPFRKNLECMMKYAKNVYAIVTEIGADGFTVLGKGITVEIKKDDSKK